MEIIKITENRYNGKYDAGSIFENTIIITLNDSMIANITKDKVNNAKFRRTFTDNNLNFISIEIPSPKITEYDELEKIFEEIKSDEKYLVPNTLSFNAANFVKTITIHFESEEHDFLVEKDSEIGKRIIEIIGLDQVKSLTNKAVIESINI